MPLPASSVLLLRLLAVEVVFLPLQSSVSSPPLRRRSWGFVVAPLRCDSVLQARCGGSPWWVLTSWLPLPSSRPASPPHVSLRRSCIGLQASPWLATFMRRPNGLHC